MNTQDLYLCREGHLFHDPNWYKGKPLTECCPTCKAIAECDEARSRHAETNSMMQDDLGDLLRALNMFDGARPQSPHEVMREVIDRVHEMRRRLAVHFDPKTDPCPDRGITYWPCHIARAFGYEK